MLEGLERALEITTAEREVAKELIPLMAMGMSQIIMLLEFEIDKVKIKESEAI